MPVIFFDNLDDEDEGTSPPSEWTPMTGLYAPDVCKVSAAHCVSSPHAVELGCALGNGICYHDVSFTTDPFSIEIITDSTNKTRRIRIQNEPGIYVSTKTIVIIELGEDGTVRYYNGVWVDTGQAYNNGNNKIDVILDHNNNQFSMWWEGVLLADGVAAYQAFTSAEGILLQTYQGTFWFDNIQVGEGDITISPPIAGSMCGVNI